MQPKRAAEAGAALLQLAYQRQPKKSESSSEESSDKEASEEETSEVIEVIVPKKIERNVTPIPKKQEKSPGKVR